MCTERTGRSENSGAYFLLMGWFSFSALCSSTSSNFLPGTHTAFVIKVSISIYSKVFFLIHYHFIPKSFFKNILYLKWVLDFIRWPQFRGCAVFPYLTYWSQPIELIYYINRFPLKKKKHTFILEEALPNYPRLLYPWKDFEFPPSEAKERS